MKLINKVKSILYFKINLFEDKISFYLFMEVNKLKFTMIQNILKIILFKIFSY